MEKATLEKFERYKVSVLQAIEQAEADGVLTGVSLALETEILKVLQRAVSQGVEGSEGTYILDRPKLFCYKIIRRSKYERIFYS